MRPVFIRKDNVPEFVPDAERAVGVEDDLAEDQMDGLGAGDLLARRKDLEKQSDK